MDKLLKEVGDLGDRMMLGLPYTAGGGVINPGVDTFSSPDVSQNPDEFDTKGSIDGGPDAYKNVEDTDSQGPLSDSPNSPELSYSPSVAGSATNINPNIPSDSKETAPKYNKDLNPYTNKDAIKDIKNKVTPDEVITGINAELRDMVFKRPDVAKSLVIKNLKKDPKYYSKLKFLNVDDKLDESFKYMTPQQIAIAKIVRNMKEKNDKKRKYNSYE